MDDPVLVRMKAGLPHLDGKLSHRGQFEGFTHEVSRAQKMTERRPLHELGDNVGRRRVHIGVDEAHDMGMLEALKSARFSSSDRMASDPRIVAGEEELHRHGAPVALIPRFPDVTGSALCDLLLEQRGSTRPPA